MKLYYLFILVGCLLACNDEDSLTPTETPEFGYSVPQGNHDYDDRIGTKDVIRLSCINLI